MNDKTLQADVGDTVNVKAWWVKGKAIQCRITINYNNGYYCVQPLMGNPHSRLIQNSDIVVQSDA